MKSSKKIKLESKPSSQKKINQFAKKIQKKHLTESETDLAPSKNDNFSSNPAQSFQDTFPPNKQTPEEVFSWLISPISKEEFFSTYWEKKPLHIARKQDNYYQTLYSKETFFNKTAEGKLHYNQQVMVSAFDPARQQKKKIEKKGVVHPKEAKQLFEKEKATFQIRHPQQYDDNIAFLNHSLESYFSTLVGSNLYLTPPFAQGLAPHYDDIEAFVLQISGKKEWKLANPVFDLANVCSVDLEMPKPEALTSLTLEAGDFLYFPRGTIHFASTLDQDSLHLTVSTYQNYSWGAFLKSSIPNLIQNAIESDIEFRQGLPLNFTDYVGSVYKNRPDLQDAQKEFEKKVKTYLEKLSKSFDIHEMTDEFALDFVTHRLPPVENIPDEENDDILKKKISICDPKNFRVLFSSDENDLPVVDIFSSYENDREQNMAQQETTDPILTLENGEAVLSLISFLIAHRSSPMDFKKIQKNNPKWKSTWLKTVLEELWLNGLLILS